MLKRLQKKILMVMGIWILNWLMKTCDIIHQIENESLYTNLLRLDYWHNNCNN